MFDCVSVCRLSRLNAMGIRVEHVVVKIVLIASAQLRTMVESWRPREGEQDLESKRGRVGLGAVGQKEQRRGHKLFRRAYELKNARIAVAYRQDRGSLAIGWPCNVGLNVIS